MKLEDSSSKSIAEVLGPIISSIGRYWKMSIGPALALLATSLFLAYRLPNYYSANSLIFIQPQRITSKVIDMPQKDEMKERLEALVQEILSRPRLRNIIDRYQLYPELKGVSGGEMAVAKFRKAIDIQPAKSPTGGTNLLQTFNLVFSYRDPKTTFEVTRALSNLFIEESIVDRRSEVQGTEEFLDAQLNEARKKLEETENKVQEFVRQNVGRLGEHSEQALARLTSAQASLDSNAQMISANLNRRQYLERELNEMKTLVTPTVVGGENTNSYDPQASLQQLQQALIVLQSRYSDQHPDVINTRKRIDALRAQMAQGGGGGGKAVVIPRGGVAPTAVLNLKREINEIDVQTQALREENERLKNAIGKLQKDIEEMPLRDQELVKIKRDYALVNENYQRLLAAREDAGIQSSLLRSQKGSQFRIVEPAEMPNAPAGPPRLIIAGVGAGAALLIFFGVPLAIFFIGSTYHSKEQVEEDLGLQVIGMIPPMVSPESLAAQRRLGWTSMYISAASFVAASVAIFFAM